MTLLPSRLSMCVKKTSKAHTRTLKLALAPLFELQTLQRRPCGSTYMKMYAEVDPYLFPLSREVSPILRSGINQSTSTSTNRKTNLIQNISIYPSHRLLPFIILRYRYHHGHFIRSVNFDSAPKCSGSRHLFVMPSLTSSIVALALHVSLLIIQVVTVADCDLL